MRTRRLQRSERGATLVEAAFVLPVIIMLMLGVFDLGEWDLAKSQASSAARDAARVASLSITGADVSGNAANTAVQTAINARIGSKASAMTFTVTCLSTTGVVQPSCVLSSDTVDRYRVKVTVSWSRTPMTFISKPFGTASVSGSSTMTISG
jgi:Flp pilus assembly protein TadG